ncbi:MAG: hypothetical protein AAFX58_09350 [Pseudomonadota bacterium]
MSDELERLRLQRDAIVRQLDRQDIRDEFGDTMQRPAGPARLRAELERIERRIEALELATELERQSDA